jgi:hypothetical protein
MLPEPHGSTQPQHNALVLNVCATEENPFLSQPSSLIIGQICYKSLKQKE